MRNIQNEIPTTSRGNFAWLLPIYTVGVVAFLIYTLVKVGFQFLFLLFKKGIGI